VYVWTPSPACVVRRAELAGTATGAASPLPAWAFGGPVSAIEGCPWVLRQRLTYKEPQDPFTRYAQYFGESMAACEGTALLMVGATGGFLAGGGVHMYGWDEQRAILRHITSVQELAGSAARASYGDALSDQPHTVTHFANGISCDSRSGALVVGMTSSSVVLVAVNLTRIDEARAAAVAGRVDADARLPMLPMDGYVAMTSRLGAALLAPASLRALAEGPIHALGLGPGVPVAVAFAGTGSSNLAHGSNPSWTSVFGDSVAWLPASGCILAGDPGADLSLSQFETLMRVGALQLFCGLNAALEAAHLARERFQGQGRVLTTLAVAPSVILRMPMSTLSSEDAFGAQVEVSAGTSSVGLNTSQFGVGSLGFTPPTPRAQEAAVTVDADGVTSTVTGRSFPHRPAGGMAPGVELFFASSQGATAVFQNGSTSGGGGALGAADGFGAVIGFGMIRPGGERSSAWEEPLAGLSRNTTDTRWPEWCDGAALGGTFTPRPVVIDAAQAWENTAAELLDSPVAAIHELPATAPASRAGVSSLGSVPFWATNGSAASVRESTALGLRAAASLGLALAMEVWGSDSSQGLQPEVMQFAASMSLPVGQRRERGLPMLVGGAPSAKFNLSLVAGQSASGANEPLSIVRRGAATVWENAPQFLDYSDAGATADGAVLSKAPADPCIVYLPPSPSPTPSSTPSASAAPTRVPSPTPSPTAMPSAGLLPPDAEGAAPARVVLVRWQMILSGMPSSWFLPEELLAVRSALAQSAAEMARASLDQTASRELAGAAPSRSAAVQPGKSGQRLGVGSSALSVASRASSPAVLAAASALLQAIESEPLGHLWVLAEDAQQTNTSSSSSFQLRAQVSLAVGDQHSVLGAAEVAASAVGSSLKASGGLDSAMDKASAALRLASTRRSSLGMLSMTADSSSLTIDAGEPDDDTTSGAPAPLAPNDDGNNSDLLALILGVLGVGVVVGAVTAMFATGQIRCGAPRAAAQSSTTNSTQDQAGDQAEPPPSSGGSLATTPAVCPAKDRLSRPGKRPAASGTARQQASPGLEGAAHTATGHQAGSLRVVSGAAKSESPSRQGPGQLDVGAERLAGGAPPLEPSPRAVVLMPQSAQQLQPAGSRAVATAPSARAVAAPRRCAGALSPAATAASQQPQGEPIATDQLNPMQRKPVRARPASRRHKPGDTLRRRDSSSGSESGGPLPAPAAPSDVVTSAAASASGPTMHSATFQF